MHERENDDSFDARLYVGIGLVGIGAIALLSVVVTVLQIISNPAKSGLIHWVMSTVAGKQAIFGGSSNGQQFEYHASEAFQYIILCLIGLIILRLITSIFMSFIKQGATLMSESSKKKEAPRPPSLMNRPPAK